MALTSGSTFDEIVAEFQDTMRYERVGSRDLALRHAEAIGFLMVELPNTSTKGSNSVGYSKAELATMAENARQYARVLAPGTTRKIHFSGRGMRRFG